MADEVAPHTGAWIETAGSITICCFLTNARDVANGLMASSLLEKLLGELAVQFAKGRVSEFTSAPASCLGLMVFMEASIGLAVLVNSLGDAMKRLVEECGGTGLRPSCLDTAMQMGEQWKQGSKMGESIGHSQLPGDMGASKERIYRSSDIYFSAYLCSLDISLVTTEVEKSSEGAKKVIFVFKVPDAELQRLKSSYFGGTGTVKARRFVDNIRSLKSMCFV